MTSVQARTAETDAGAPKRETVQNVHHITEERRP